ncbi:MAG: 50S ribosomal protein L17 [Candidatus Blackburnbacteria bacterium]|nr:50S ribosomal protein L17 [Candidatus Blackburnbacteria bacterium]
MLKRNRVKKLGRDKDARRALFKSLVSSLFEKGSLSTSEQRAKAVVPLVDRIVAIAKKGDLNAQKRISVLLSGDRRLVRQVIERAKNIEKTSGVTRIVKLGRRLGDGSQRVKLELLLNKQVSVEVPSEVASV